MLLIVTEAFVVVVDSDGEHLLGLRLSDDILIKKGLYFLRCGYVGQLHLGRGRMPLRSGCIIKNLLCQTGTICTNISI